MKDNYFLMLAKKASENSDHHTYKMGCVIAKGSKVLGTGFNVLKTHPKSPHIFKSTHAEYLAFLNSKRNIKNATVYIFRQHKNGDPALARPCKDCYNFLMKQGIKRIVYTFEGSFVEERVR